MQEAERRLRQKLQVELRLRQAERRKGSYRGFGDFFHRACRRERRGTQEVVVRAVQKLCAKDTTVFWKSETYFCTPRLASGR